MRLMKNQIRASLKALYGEAAGLAAAESLEHLLKRFRPSPSPLDAPRNGHGLSQRSAILITYADQVHHPGMPPLQTLTECASRWLAEVISGIHLLPFYPSSSDDGFAVKDYFQVDPALGSWQDIRRLGEQFPLMFDAVFNHVSAQSAWFQGFLRGESRYRDFFIEVQGDPDLSQVVRPRTLPLLTSFSTPTGPKRIWTTFSSDQVDLNFRNPAVFLAVVEALLFYLHQGARYIRLDAIAFLWKEIGTPCLHQPQTHLLIQLFRAILDEVAPHLVLVTETNVPHHENLSYFGNGADEAQMVYNFALPPLVLHSLQTGDAQELTRWAHSLALPSGQVTFFNFLASHDGIGLNPVRGILSEAAVDALAQRTLEHGGYLSYKSLPDGRRIPYEMNINYLDALSNPKAQEPLELAAAKFLTAESILMSLQGVPGIYFHSLFGSRGDQAGAEASGIPRRINRQKLPLNHLEAELRASGSLRRRIYLGHRGLMLTRRLHPAFAPGAPQQVLRWNPAVFALIRRSEEPADEILCLHNVGPQPVTLPVQQLTNQSWRPLWACRGSHSSGTVVTLEAYDSMWLTRAR